MQTFFVHGFGWLAQVPGHEFGQIVAARLVMVAFLMLTCHAIWRMGSRLADPQAYREIDRWLDSVDAHGFDALEISAGWKWRQRQWRSYACRGSARGTDSVPGRAW